VIAVATSRTRVADVLALLKLRFTPLVLLTTLAGMCVAPGRPPTALAVLTLSGVGLVVSAAHALNQYIERDVDTLMERTRDRPLPSGRLAPEVALRLGLALAPAGIFVLTVTVNALTALLGVLALGSYVLAYTPLKRRTDLALLVGTLPGALPPLMGWTAATGEVGAVGLLLFAVLVLWQLPHFLAIALFRRGDYERAGLKVWPAERGEGATKALIVVSVVMLVAATVMFVPLGVAGLAYLLASLAAGALFLGWAASGLGRHTAPGWARGLFVVSLAHLTVVLGTLTLVAG
jgi:protoheme IX farnesyltransferase